TRSTTIYLLFALVGLGITAYNRWFQAGKTGQSWGKRALGITLLSEQTGQPIGAGMAFVRDICHFVDAIICYIGFLFPLWAAKRQTRADKTVRTVVLTVCPAGGAQRGSAQRHAEALIGEQDLARERRRGVGQCGAAVIVRPEMGEQQLPGTTRRLAIRYRL